MLWRKREREREGVVLEARYSACEVYARGAIVYAV